MFLKGKCSVNMQYIATVRSWLSFVTISFFVKPTEGGRVYIGNIVEAAPYPGAKLSFLIEDAFEDREWISGLIKITAQELPIPNQKRSKTKGAKK